MVYKFRPNGTFLKSNVDPQIIGEELAAIRADIGKLESREVLERAKDIDSPLHPCFTWDDGIAADYYRVSQARSLIKSIVKVQFEGDEPTPVYYNVVVRTTDDSGTETTQQYYQDAVVITPNEYKGAHDIMLKELMSAQKGLEGLEKIAPHKERRKIQRAKKHTEAAHAALV